MDRVETSETSRSRVLLLRYSGEVSTKASATRRRFGNRLVRNVKAALASVGVQAAVEQARDRMLVATSEAPALDVLSRVFGLQSVSLAERRPAGSLAEVVRDGAAIFAPAVRGKRYAVRAKRVGNPSAVPFRARELEHELGAALAPGAGRVDLDHPEFSARVELYRSHAYYCLETRRGEGGLPLGAEGYALALVSGGFDSAVAAWQILRRGVRVDYVFLNLGGRTHELGVLRVMKLLTDRWSHGHRPMLFSVDFAPVARDIQAHTQPRYWQVLLKRSMLRAAEALARERDAEALITGEALGQVSSQTLTNLASISEVTSLPILRPLVGANKSDIIQQARHLGTAPLSEVVSEYCDLAPSQPATAARVEALRGEELAMDPTVLAKVLGEREGIDLGAVDPEARGLPEIRIEAIPTDARVIDLRSRREFDSWHPQEALHLDFGHAQRAFPAFERGPRYVLYCEYGLKSSHLAEQMRAAGFEAFHFVGGTRALRRWCEAQRRGS